MNSVEQRQRHTAVQTAERRIDDLDVVIQALSMEIVQYRDQFGETLERERQTRRVVLSDLRTGIAGVSSTLNEFTQRTFWQRLSWLVFGQ